MRVLFILTIFPLLVSAQVEKVLEDWKKDKGLSHASIGFSVLDAKTGSLLAEHNSQLALTPASTLKIFTTYAALSKLGAHHHFETRLYYTGHLDEKTGILDGDLIVVGQGDPSLQSEYFSKDNSPVTDKWAKQLKEKGIKEIKGKVIGDASFIKRAIPGEWIWADIGNYYGTTPSGLSFMDNKFSIDFQTAAPGSLAQVLTYTPSYVTKTIQVVSEVRAEGTGDETIVYGDPATFGLLIQGSLPPNKKHFEIEAALPDPALLCAEMFCKSLNAVGIKCDPHQAESRYTEPNVKEKRVYLFSHFSPELSQIVTQTNLKSNNLYSESLLRTLGKGNAQKGIEELFLYWEQRGMDLSSLTMNDGCGLSRSNTTSADLLAKVLVKIYSDGDNYKIFNASLPIAGKTGSMANVGKGRSIEGNLRAKTGYIERVRAYAGYVKSRSGKELAFAILVNNYSCTAQEMRLKIENFLVALETF